jgi:hypothetical protein
MALPAKLQLLLEKIGSFFSKIAKGVYFLRPTLPHLGIGIVVFFALTVGLVITTQSACEFPIDATGNATEPICTSVTLTGFSFLQNMLLFVPASYLLASIILLVHSKFFDSSIIKNV